MSKLKTKDQKNSWFDQILQRPYPVILIACLLPYVQILSFGLVHFDDHGFVLMAADTLKLSNIPKFFQHSVFWVLGDTTQQFDVFYRPLQNVVYALCNTIASKQAWVYHLAGLGFHITACILLFNFLRELKYHVSVALVFALIYGLHPVLVQGVAWIAGIGDQMATVFSLLSLIYFIRSSNPDAKERNKNLFFHFLFFGCALFSKEVSIMIIPLCLFFYFIRPNGAGKHAHEKAAPQGVGMALMGWMAVAAFFFFLRSRALPPSSTGLLDAAVGSMKANIFLVLEYFEKMFVPYRLSPIPSREDAQIIVGAIVLVIFLVLIVLRKRMTAMAGFGLLWFVIFLFPTFIQQNPQAHFFAFEHRLYLPLIGILIMMIELLNIPQINIRSSFQKYGFALLLLLFFGITFSHSKTFSDPYTFYDKAISSSPKSVIAYNGYGKLLLEDKKYIEAVSAFKKSYEYKSDDIQTTGKIGELYLKNLNDPKRAIVWFKKTMDIAPNSVEAAVSIGDAYWSFLHDTANAIAWYSNAVKIDGQNEFALANLGVIYATKGNIPEARKFLSQSLSVSPKNLLALKWMAITYFNEGNIIESVSYLVKAFENNPEDIDLQRNLMICYYKLNDSANTKKFAALYSKGNNPIPAEIDTFIKTGARN